MKKIIRIPLFTLLIIGLYLLMLQVTNNFGVVSKGEVYRAGQINAKDLAEYTHKYNLRSVLNLRGENLKDGWYKSEVAESEKLGIKHIDFKMSAKKELTPEQVQNLIAVMRDAPKPLLIHCRAGSDRTGLAAALYLAAIKKDSEFNSELQLSLLYGHIPLWFIPEAAMDRTLESAEPILGYSGS